MSYIYDWNPIPDELNIKCPNCHNCATFKFAKVVKIILKKDLPFFQENDIFEYKIFQDSCGHYWNGAVFYPNLYNKSTNLIKNLPKGYKPNQWQNSEYHHISYDLDFGAFNCNYCQKRKKHILSWPKDAYYSITYKDKILWAFNREFLLELKNYISSQDRKTSRYKWSNYLIHIPTLFKREKARSSIVKQLNRILLK